MLDSSLLRIVRRRGVALALAAALANTAPAQPTPATTPAAANAIPERLLTVAERTDWKETARHADVVSLLDALAAEFPLARRASLGTSHEGRDLPVLIIADPPVSTPEEARAQKDAGKVLVLAIGNIHAGEVCGKEALPMLAREILSTNDRAILDHVILAIAPIYNADGNERVDRANRPTQNGPEGGMGIRENAQGFDLNRDFVKLEAPETRGLVGFFNAWDPDLFIDTHTTNGSYHRYIVSHGLPKSLAGDARIRELARGPFIDHLATHYKAISGEPTFTYGSFGGGVFSENPRDKTRWGTYPAEIRFGTTYVGVRGRLSLLSEAYTYAPYQERVLRTRDFVRAACLSAADLSGAIRTAVRAADAPPAPGAEAVIRSRLVPCPGRSTVLGYEEEERDGRLVNTGEPAEYKVQVIDCFEPERTVRIPVAYVFPDDPRLQGVVRVLRLHGITVEKTTQAREAKVERSTITSATSASRAFQGHALVRADATVQAETMTIPAGWWRVDVAQPRHALLVHLLEPASEDGLTVWNFFDPWMKAGETFPMRRVMGE